MDELALEEFRHGGVNITGFALLDKTSPGLRAFEREWTHLDPRYWHGAGRGRPITVSPQRLCFGLDLNSVLNREFRSKTRFETASLNRKIK